MIGEEDLDEGCDTEDTKDEVRLPLDVPERDRYELEVGKVRNRNGKGGYEVDSRRQEQSS